MSKSNNIEDLQERLQQTKNVIQCYRITKSVPVTSAKMGISKSKVYDILTSNDVGRGRRGRPSKLEAEKAKALTADNPVRSYDG